MESYILLAFIIFLAAIFGSRMLTERGNKYLDADKKSGLIDLFSKDRIYGLAIIIGIVVLFMLSMYYGWFSLAVSTTIYVIVLLIFMAASTYRSWMLLKKNNYPNAYIRLYLLSTGIRLVGILLFLSLMFYPMLKSGTIKTTSYPSF